METNLLVNLVLIVSAYCVVRIFNDAGNAANHWRSSSAVLFQLTLALVAVLAIGALALPALDAFIAANHPIVD